MAESKPEVYIFSARDEIESKRLNEQNSLIVASCDGNLIHPSIPKSESSSVADIGAGTGAWLLDLQKALPDAQLTGFDLSDKQFPTSTTRSGINWAVQNMLEPFPEKYHGTFDLVQARYMVVALKADQFNLAIRNIAQLLKPGGYFQWVEFDSAEWDHYPESEHLVHLLNWLREVAGTGFSLQPSKIIHESFISLGFKDIVYEDYNSFKHRDLDDQARNISLSTWRNASIPSLLATGRAKSQEEAVKMSEQGCKEISVLYENGTVPRWPTKMVVGRKAV